MNVVGRNNLTTYYNIRTLELSKLNIKSILRYNIIIARTVVLQCIVDGITHSAAVDIGNLNCLTVEASHSYRYTYQPVDLHTVDIMTTLI